MISTICLAIVKIVFCGAACERIASIIVTSAIFEPLRSLLGKKAYPDTPPGNTLAAWLHKLITCTECTGIWVSILLYFIADIRIVENAIGNAIITIFSIAYFGQLFEVYRRGRVSTLEIDHRIIDPVKVNIETNQCEPLTCEVENGN